MRPIVVIDPGHGGKAVTAGSSPNNATGYNGLLEKTLTLEVAENARRALGGEADVRLTRTGDTNLGLQARAQVARSLAAPVFVSLHFNGAVKPDGSVNEAVNGTEAHIATAGFTDRKLLAQSLVDRVCAFAHTRNRGVKTNDLGVLLGNRHDPHTAATLVELSFLTNHAEADRLATSAYRDGLGQAVADGILDFLAGMSRATSASADAALWYSRELSAPSPEIYVPTVVEVIDRGDAQYDWWGFNVESKDYIATFYTFIDALKDRTTGLRLPCRAAEAQQAADRIKARPKDLPGWYQPPDGDPLPSLLLTPKLLDMRWAGAAVQKQIADPCPQNVAGILAEESKKLNKCLTGQVSSSGKWVADPGKIWALTNQLGGTIGRGDRAVNYGWHVHASRVKNGKWNGIGLEASGTKGQWVIQGPGTRHDAYHIDYSQILLLVAGWCQVIFPGEENPRTMKTADVYRSKDLAHLVTYDGAPLRLIRQPFKEDVLAEATKSYWNEQEKQYQRKKAAAGAKALGAADAGEELVHCDLLNSHVAGGDNLGLRWNAMSTPPDQIDVVLHLHGFVGIKAPYDVGRKTQASGIELANRSRPTLGLMPIGRRGGPSKSGTLATYGIPALLNRNGEGANDLIRWARDRFAQAHGGGAPTIARRIYTAHSGGGARLLLLLGAGPKDQSLPRTHDPHELQLFDCFYESPTAVIAWMRRHLRADADRLGSTSPEDWNRVMARDGGALRLMITEGTRGYSQTLASAIAAELRGVTNPAIRTVLARFYRVERVPYKNNKPVAGTDHDSIPNTYGAQFLQDAGADVTPAPASLVSVNGATVKAHETLELDVSAFGIKPFPDRPAGAAGGSAVMDRFKGETEPARPGAWNAREDGFATEIINGNFPPFLRRWVEIPVTCTDDKKRVRTGRFRVLPDLVSIGDNQDYVIAPLDAFSAGRVADAFGCLLPTAKMVQAIYDVADFKHVAITRDYAKTNPLKQASTWAYVEHDSAIKSEYASRGVTSLAEAGRLLKEGHKKNVVIYPGMNTRKKLAYYGWFKANRKPIQGEENGGPGITSYTRHPLAFADYSQGIRLVHPVMTIDTLDGTPKEVSVAKVLAHKVFHRLLSNEGPLTEPRLTVTR